MGGPRRSPREGSEDGQGRGRGSVLALPREGEAKEEVCDGETPRGELNTRTNLRRRERRGKTERKEYKKDRNGKTRETGED